MNTEKNKMTAEAKALLQAAEQGDAKAQFQLGYCFFNGHSVEKNEEEAVKWYTKAAEQGFPFAQYRLYGITKIREAEKGNADAQFELGDCYLYGDCVEKNEAEAVKWFTKAAEQGQAEAQEMLSKLK